jgi:hypothetical protein
MFAKKHISKLGSTKFLVKRHKDNYGCGVIENRTVKTLIIFDAKMYIQGHDGS